MFFLITHLVDISLGFITHLVDISFLLIFKYNDRSLGWDLLGVPVRGAPCLPRRVAAPGEERRTDQGEKRVAWRPPWDGHGHGLISLESCLV